MGRLVLVLWFFPFVEMAFLGWGLGRFLLTKSRKLGTSGATEAIIQITTIGNFETVNEIISSIREYDLPFPYQFWVVVEPGIENHYVGADEVIVVPESFVTLAHYKARAQEFSRRVRALRGLDRHDVKIIMLDDDSLPTRKYFIDVFGADYDVCEGILTPRRGYGRFLSHLDDLRTYNCLTVCSFWQGGGHPIWVHGEGLTLRGSAEAIVTWNYPVNASEDLTVGHNAVERGLSFGFVWSYIQVTSPWTWQDFCKQRRRWTWGNIYALRTGLIPPMAAAIVAARWVLGAVMEILVTLALVLVPLGIWKTPDTLTAVLLVSLMIWLATYGAGCWISSGEEGATLAQRLGNTLVGTALAPVSSFLTTYVIIASIAQGDPKGFQVIEKAKPGAR